MNKVNFSEQMQLDFYHNMDHLPSSGKKDIGFNIIKNNDSLQYHYFSQEYHVVKTAGILVIISIIQNNIKHYVGFMALGTFSLDKQIRNQLLGGRFFPHIYVLKNSIPALKNLRSYNITRLVFLPSFRGIGINKVVQEKVMDFLSEDQNCLHLEISSQMLNNFDFLSNRFNKTFLNCNLQHFTPAKQTKKSAATLKGFKGESKYIATTATYTFLNDKNIRIIQILYKKIYNILLDFDEIKEKFNCSLDLDSYNYNDIQFLKDNKIAINFLNFYSMEDCKKIVYKSFVPAPKKKIKEAA